MEKRITNQEAYEKADELLSQMTLEEIASQLTARSPEILRLNIPGYHWWNEGLHGVARAGTATVFPQAIAMAAMFDPSKIKQVAEVIAVEGRAKYNAYVKQKDRDIYKGLTFWSPNINIFRDPRWGRGHETYGEDPYLTRKSGVAFIQGLQGDGKYLKLAACAKHFAVHSGPEELRHEFDAVVDKKDLYETYLPAFEAAVKEAGVESIMGAYNRVNGEPACGSRTLLKSILREKWGFEGHVVSDCGAIADFHNHHMVTKTPYESAALALESGCDLNCGTIYMYAYSAVQKGMLKEKYIRESARRLLATRVKLGMFADDCEYDSISYSENDTPEHHDLSLETARKSMVLLKNNGVLPVDRTKISSVAVIGPNADNRTMLMGNYAGTASEQVTLLEGIREAAGKNVRIYFSEGCHLYKDNVEGGLALQDDREAEAVTVALQADVVFLCLGYDASIEGEQGDTNNLYAAGDRKSLGLPGRQQHLLEKIVMLGKPTVLLLGAGGAVTFGGMEDKLDAILDVWYPGSFGGRAAAQLIFGDDSPSGKLPITFYRTEDELPDFEDYSMKGRTYRYMHGEAMYPFGYGLTYSKVVLKTLNFNEILDDNFEFLDVNVEIENTGNYEVEEVIQVYVKDLESKFAVLNYQLAGFARVSLLPKESKKQMITLERFSFEAVDDEGNRFVDSTRFRIFAGVSQPDKRSCMLTGTNIIKKDCFVKKL